MKKILSIFWLILFLTSSAYADDEAFYNALENCKPYRGSGQTKTEGSVAQFRSQILGWENDKCVYKEHVNFSGIDACTTCKLSRKQIDELVRVMRAYSTVQQYAGEDVDTSKLENVQNNPVVKVWNKYFMDSTVCNIELSK